jgi:hypothetical protein
MVNPSRESSGLPRWGKVLGILVAVVVLLVVVMMLTRGSGHNPPDHGGGNGGSGGGNTPAVSQSGAPAGHTPPPGAH